MTIRVGVCGALGKMGQEVVKTVLADPALELVGTADLNGKDRTLKEATNGSIPSEVKIHSDLNAMLTQAKPQVVVDFTHPSTVLSNGLAIIQAGARPIIGTTGLSEENLNTLGEALKTAQLGGLVAPNFALGAVLMMKFAQEAAKYFEHAEIIEMHHNQKADAPSGTSIKTAELMAESRQKFGVTNAPEKETYPGARGGKGPADIQIHSVRLPGYVAHQEVLFGGQGQILTLRHDSIDRTSFMPGVAMACQKIMDRQGLIYGLEHLL